MSKQPSTLQALFAEMMRRRVFRVMAVYGVVAFMMLQIAELIFPMLLLPDWATRLVLGLAMVGFPIAIVIAWAFEATDEGIRRTPPASQEEIQRIVSAPVKHRWPAGLLALAGMALLFWGGWWMGNRGADNPANVIVPQAQASEFKTIAALPFENVNGHEDNRLIAVGVHEDLLTQLQRIAALRVTGSASVREYENTDKSFDEIAMELGVDYLLDGSVRSSGGQVRVNVALLDAASGEQLWGEQYDEEVTPDNLFDIQSRIARQVVAKLEAELTPGEEATLESLQPAASSVAQQWYYRGVDSWTRVSEIRDARDAMQRAVELDPNYLAAWSRLAWYESRLGFVDEDRSAEAEAAMERTEALGPGTVEAYLARGYFEYYVRRDFAAALAAFQAAERLAPSDSEVASSIGLILRRQGDWRGSAEAMRRASRLDPRNALPLQFLAEDLMYMGSFQAADPVLERALSVSPGNADLRAYKVFNLISLDRSTQRAGRLAAELGLDARQFTEGNVLAWIARVNRDLPGSLAILDAMDTRGISSLEELVSMRRAWTLDRLGDPSAAAVADSVVALIDGRGTVRMTEHTMRGIAHAVAGRRQAALQDLGAADRELRTWDDHVDPPLDAYSVVVGYATLGDVDRGISLLEELGGRPNPALNVATLMLDPALDPFRDDPRFNELIRKREAFEADWQAWADANGPWVP